jgi:biotin carboxylase
MNRKMERILLIATTTGYQIRSFGQAAERLGVDLILATDRCHVLDDPWRDGAISIRFTDEIASLEAISQALETRSIMGIVAVGDRPALLAALVAKAMTLPGNSPDAVRIAGNKLLTRSRLRDAKLPSPWFVAVPTDTPVADLPGQVEFPCVVKPLKMSASRGVVRVNSLKELSAAMRRVGHIQNSVEVQALRDPANSTILIEEYLPGREVAVEGVLTNGIFRKFGVFDKPDLLEGPFFEETIYVTPSRNSEQTQQRIRQAVSDASDAVGLTDGPVHAECRIGADDIFVLEIAPRPIGGLCSRALRFSAADGEIVSLEYLLLRHAMGQPISDYRREEKAAGVMMIPIPADGLYKGVDGLDVAQAVPYVEDVVITARRDQRIRPLPEGDSYLGFIFARASQPTQIESALRSAHRCLEFRIEASIPVVSS